MDAVEKHSRLFGPDAHVSALILEALFDIRY